MKVDDILHANPFLVPLLEDAYAQILVHFPYSQSSLEVDPDQEDADGCELLLTINADLEPDEAFKTLQNFDDNWWLHNMERAQGCLSIFLQL